jgi:hypothetical protein
VQELTYAQRPVQELTYAQRPVQELTCTCVPVTLHPLQRVYRKGKERVRAFLPAKSATDLAELGHLHGDEHLRAAAGVGAA